MHTYKIITEEEGCNLYIDGTFVKTFDNMISAAKEVDILREKEKKVNQHE